MPTQTEKSRQSARLFLSAVPQTETLPTPYRYASALTRPIRYMEETGGGGGLCRRTKTLRGLYGYVGSLTRPT